MGGGEGEGKKHIPNTTHSHSIYQQNISLAKANDHCRLSSRHILTFIHIYIPSINYSGRQIWTNAVQSPDDSDYPSHE